MSAIKGKIKKVVLYAQKKYQKVFYGSCAVLLYHRVTQLKTDPQQLSVTPTNFNTQLEYLKSNYHLLTIKEFQYHLENKKKFPKKSVLITFDDGYADNYLEALPILEKHNIQGLFYIATGTLNTDVEFWWDAVERIVLLSDNQTAVEKYVLNGIEYNLSNLDKTKRFELYERLLPALRVMNSSLREEKIDELGRIFFSSQGRVSHRSMTFEDLKKMDLSKSAVIGAHTHLHPSLAALTYEEQLKEIQTSKNILEEHLNKKITHFSYPFGTIKDFNADTLEIMKKLNFELVAANIPYLVHKNTDRYSFTRFLVRDWNSEEFEKQMKSFFQ
jgi:peptidoglycan/xylan/chitin deacetylase (PgdA/CDA1 family)